MNNIHLNEHDANQGAQSKGEFLGMTGNSAWYLLGSAGASIMIVIVLWGMLGLSLLLCLIIGLVLCVLSLTYVFMLKNNKPEHYDTDFFESVLVEAGLLELAFGPRVKRPSNPFLLTDVDSGTEETARSPRAMKATDRGGRSSARGPATPTGHREAAPARSQPEANPKGRDEEGPKVSLADYERLQGELSTTKEMLEDAIAAHEEDGLCD
ncbi:MAG TPA: DUF4133 domain-containing protein [Opitutaceae bacterium]|nr:DUF4133 domain-containing protein [Opitutaceae bacterium]